MDYLGIGLTATEQVGYFGFLSSRARRLSKKGYCERLGSENSFSSFLSSCLLDNVNTTLVSPGLKH